MSRLFISHSSGNNPEAVALRDWLADEGWNEVFLDLDPERGIAAGERWERALNEAASRCEAVLFLISREWLASRWCLKEFNLARRLNKRLFGVLIEAIAVTDLPADLTGTWQVVDLGSGQDHLLLRVILPRTQEETHVSFSREGLARLRGGLAKAGLNPRFFAWPPEHDPDRAPYRGLKALEAEDAGIFFGRDAPIVEALDTLRGLRDAAAPRLLVILGASGAGKSSFLRAGLLPRLERDDRNFLPLPVIRPERAAISGETGLVRALEAALAMRGLPQSRAGIRDAVAAGAEAVRPLLARLVDKVFATMLGDENDAKRPVVVMSIDQAEELFLGEGAKEGQALLELVHDLVAEDRPGVIALFTIRSDSYDRLETAKALEGMRQQTLPLLPMPRGAYQTVIEGPATRLKETNRPLAIEARLTQRLLEDIEKGGGSDALPLLAFTLEQLYLDYGGSGALKVENYERFGGIRGAIEAAVERALIAADQDPRIPSDRDARLALLRRALIPWLAGIDPETGSPRRRIARLADIPQEAEPLIRLLVEQRLLITDRIVVRDGDKERSEITVEPAHEALLRQWGVLQRWLQDDFGALATLEGVKRAARDWAANARAADWLNHAGTRLDDAEKVAARPDLAADLTIDARDYLRGCRERETAEQRARIERLEREREEQERRVRDAQVLAAANRRTAQRTGIGLVAALLLALLAGWQWRMAQTETRLAEQAAQEAKAQRVLAEQAAHDAKAQRDRAEHALTVATDIANGLIFDIAQKFRDVAGVPVSLVKDILDRARKVQEQLIGAGEATPQLRVSQAAALMETAQTLLTLGDTKGSLAAARQAQSILQDLLATEPNNAAWQRELSVAYNKVADVLVAQGNLADALKSYRAAVAIIEPLAKANPGNSGWQRDLVVSYNRVADVLAAQGNLPEALTSYRASLAIIERLAKADPGNAGWQGDLAVSYNKLGDVQVAQGNLREALTSYQAGLAIRERLARANPGNAGWQRDLAVSDDKVGDVLLAQGKLSEALRSYQAGLAIREFLAKADPGNAGWQHDLSVSDEKLGDVLQIQGNLTEALKFYQASLAIIGRLAKADPGNAGWQRDFSVAYNKVGNVQEAQGNLAEALKSFQAGLAIIDRLAKADPGNAGWTRDLSISYDRVGDVLLAQGNPAEALKSYQGSLAIRERLAKADPGNAGWQRDLSVAHNKIGDALRAQGNLPEALKSFQAGLEIIERLAKADPGNAGWQHDLSVSYDRVGDVFRAQGNLAEALNAYQASFAIRDRLTKADPDNAGWQRDLAVSNERLGDVHIARNENDAAKAAFERALAIYTQLLARSPDNTYFLVSSTVPLMRLGQLNGADGRPYFEKALAILKRLNEAGRLEPRRKSLIGWIEQQLAALEKAQTGQR